MSTQQAAQPDHSRSSDSESPLLRLPQELLIRVASYLTTPELGHLRRVCKDVESRLFESFAYEFFHKRQFMIEEPSLQALIDISNHPTLSKRLTEVIISTTQYGEAGHLASTTAQRLLLGGYAPYSIFNSSGEARDMLVEAFRKLPNLRKVGLRDYDARGRYRDGDNASWRSYGHSFAGDELSHNSRPDQPWAILLLAVALSGAQVPSIEVFLRHHWRLSDSSFDVLGGRMSRKINPVLSQLKSLMLTLDSDRILSNNPALAKLQDIRLKKFLHHAPVLEHLRLNFDEGRSALLDWLALSPPTSSIAGSTTSHTLDDYAGPVSFPHLTTLDLGMVRVDCATLLKALTRFQLKTFNLWKVTFWVSDRSTIKSDTERNIAATFLEKLANAKQTQQVERAMLGFLKVNGDSDASYRAYDVNFAPADQRPKKKPANGTREKLKHQVVSFSLGGRAPDFAIWAKEMAECAYVTMTNRGVPISDQSDEDDEDDSEMGEDDSDVDEVVSDDDEDEDEDEE